MLAKLSRLGFALSLILVLGFEYRLHAGQIWEDFPLVTDRRNFKESKGGKGVPPQGSILDDSLRSLEISPTQTQSLHPLDKKWRYAIAINLRRGDRSIEDIVKDIATKLIRPDQQNRLAIILGVNEKINFDVPFGYAPSWSEILGGEKIQERLKIYNIPILLNYFQWTSFREERSNPLVSSAQVRQKVFERLNHIQSNRQRDGALDHLRKEDNSHQFPFGKSRELDRKSVV